MYLTQRDKITALLQTIINAVDYMIDNGEYSLLDDCRDGAASIAKYMVSIGWNPGIPQMNDVHQRLASVANGEIDPLTGSLEIRQRMNSCKEGIGQAKCRYKAAFLPYKADMWNSLESIWQAAAADELCDPVVIPIPYADIGGKEPEWHCEADRFPKYVPVMNFFDYQLGIQEPEMIFIHNPYDDQNNLTTVHPSYYSKELKKHTKCLVYSPYFTVEAFEYGRHDFHYLSSANIQADKIVVQSACVKDIYRKYYGFKGSKLLAYGSPKIDAVVNRKDISVPDEWKEKIAGRKVFLLNTHLSYFPQGSAGVEKHGCNYAVKHHTELLNLFLRRDDCSLIWRPHPLLKKMVKSRCPECMEFIRYFEEELIKSKNCLVDETPDYLTAFHCSDGMITTYSSLINEYLVTGKPVMLFSKKRPDEVLRQSPVDTGTCYFRFDETAGMGFESYVDMVIKGEDPNYQERMDMLHRKAFANMDGSAGRKIYAAVIKGLGI